MKKLVSPICFCLFLTLIGLIVFLPKSVAQNNLLQNLIDLPAPPPAKSINKDSTKKTITIMPADDAPIEDLMAFWENYGRSNRFVEYIPKASEKSLDRLMDEIEKNPRTLTKYLNAFPRKDKYIEFVKKIYDQDDSEKKVERYWREQVKEWLTNNSDYFTDDLVQAAEQIKDTNEYLTEHHSFVSLAEINWEKAKPIVDRMLNDSSQPITQTLARWVSYQHATAEGNSIDAEKFRKELQETVENKNNKPGNRDLAMDAIALVGDFDGRDDWYISLFEDETLADIRVNGRSFTGLKTIVMTSDPEKYIDKMIELCRSNKKAVRTVAAQNLGLYLSNQRGLGLNSIAEKKRTSEVIQALLPWLEDPNWAKEITRTRQQLVAGLSAIKMPESVPGLIAMLNEKVLVNESDYGSNAAIARAVERAAEAVARAANTASNARPMSMSQSESFPYQTEAIQALAFQKDMRAVNPLRVLLSRASQNQAENLIDALLECNGFSISEQIHALEIVAKNSLNQNKNDNTNTAYSGLAIPDKPSANAINYDEKPFNQRNIPIVLGEKLVRERDVSDELATAVIDRISVLQKTSPNIATILRSYIKLWKGKGVNSLMLKDLKNGIADVDSVIKLLTIRKELRENQSGEIFDMRRGNPIALGISACILEENREYDAILESNNVDAKIAMLGCAKLLRADLPIQKVAENLLNQNKMLVIAAERFLETEDSPEARQIVLSRHPNEAKILGATTYFSFGTNVNQDFTLTALFNLFSGATDEEENYFFYPNSKQLDENEIRLQKEVKENAELIGIYSLDNNFVRIYKDKAVFSWEEDAARYRERTLKPEEFNSLTGFLSDKNVDEIPTFIDSCLYCSARELLMIGKQGGRRIFMKSQNNPPFFDELDKIFEKMRQPKAKLHYWIEKSVPGLEVLFADEKFNATVVWKDGETLKLLLENHELRKQIDKELNNQRDEEMEKAIKAQEKDFYQKVYEADFLRRKQRVIEEFSWHIFDNSNIGGITNQPADLVLLPRKDGVKANWNARTANISVTTDNKALYKTINGQTTIIKTGSYTSLVISENGQWVFAIKFDQANYVRNLVRINLTTGKEFVIEIPEDYYRMYPAVYNSANNKFLVVAGQDYYPEDDDEPNSEKGEKYFFVDPETGIVQQTKGDVLPLIQQTYRRLQSNGVPNQFWTAITEDNSTEFGIYDAKLLKFRPIIKLSNIAFNSMDMFVDEKNSKLYFIYLGHLLRMPLPQESKK